MMNIVFLISSPANDLIGKKAIGAIAAGNLFGENISPLFTISIAVILLSAVSVQIMIGPRVFHAMAKDKLIFYSLDRINPKYNTPDLAIIIQVSVTIFYIFIGMDSIFTILKYIGFALLIFPMMAVIGLIILRFKKPDIHRPFKMPLLPLVSFIYLSLTLFMMITTMITNFKASMSAVGILLIGVVIYFIWQKYLKTNHKKN